MRWFARAGKAAVLMLALYGIFCEVYNVDIGQPMDRRIWPKVFSFVAGYTPIYKARLEVWEKSSVSMLYIWAEPNTAPDCGFRFTGLDVRAMRGPAPPPAAPLAPDLLARYQR